MAGSSIPKSLLKNILSEMRLAGKEGGKLQGSPAANYLLGQFRKFQETEKQHCRASEEMRHLASSYHSYLRSQRLWAEVHAEYHAKGERSVRESANLVGFKLPHDPK